MHDGFKYLNDLQISDVNFCRFFMFTVTVLLFQKYIKEGFTVIVEYS